MDLKKQLHWRMNKNPRRFTYGGFLFCKCGALLYSKNYRGDYYICKARCGAKYQQRVLIDPLLDKMFSEKLTSSEFLQTHVMPAFRAKPKSDAKYERIQAQLRTLGAKRQRILDAYFDSVIDSAERDKRIAELDRERTALNAIASRDKPRATLSLEMLVDTFAPFVEFDLLNREDKRALLNTITPSITVSDYHVQGMYIGLEVNHTVVAIGWIAETAGLDLDQADVAIDKRGFIRVDQFLRTSAPHVFAAGDVTGRIMLVPQAIQDGFVAATNAVRGATMKLPDQAAPIGSFTDPEYAQVGLTEARARETHNVVTGIVHFNSTTRTIIDGRPTGFCKLIVDGGTRNILGCHVVGERAVEITQVAAVAMAGNMRVDELAQVPLSFPTYAGVLGRVAAKVTRQLNLQVSWQAG